VARERKLNKERGMGGVWEPVKKKTVKLNLQATGNPLPPYVWEKKGLLRP